MIIAVIALAVACSTLTVTISTLGYFYFKSSKQINSVNKQIADLRIQIVQEIQLRDNAEQSLIEVTSDYYEEAARNEKHIQLLKNQYQSLLSEMEALQIPGSIKNLLNDLFASMVKGEKN